MRVRKFITVLVLVLAAIIAVYLYVKPKKEIKPVRLENEKTISRYDVTGDGKKRVYLAIEEQAPNNDDIYGYALFQVEKGKLQKVCDFYNPIAESITNSHYYVNISNMTSKSMTTECSDQLYATGRIVWRMNYAYKDGEWKETGNEYDVSYNPDNEWIDRSSGWTANRKLSVYTTTSLEQECFIVEKGEVVKIQKLCIQDGNTYLQLTNQSGETGWIQNPKEYCEGYFEEVHFAG